MLVYILVRSPPEKKVACIFSHHPETLSLLEPIEIPSTVEPPNFSGCEQLDNCPHGVMQFEYGFLIVHDTI